MRERERKRSQRLILTIHRFPSVDFVEIINKVHLLDEGYAHKPKNEIFHQRSKRERFWEIKFFLGLGGALGTS